MPEIVGVSFSKEGKVYYFDPRGEQYKEGEYVLAETARGVELGQVVIANSELDEEKLVSPLKPIVRRAKPTDLKKRQRLDEKAPQALAKCAELVAKHGLPMKLLSAEYTFDERKLVFHFSAEGRVDFRALLKDLAKEFKKRIELHQVGARDEARLYGALGICGRELCCKRFLKDFAPVAIKMAKAQELSLNPAKISGVCGRLMCCLRFEYELYEESQRILPKVNTIVGTPLGDGRVVERHLLQKRVVVELEDKKRVEFKPEELGPPGQMQTQAEIEPAAPVEQQAEKQAEKPVAAEEPSSSPAPERGSRRKSPRGERRRRKPRQPDSAQAGGKSAQAGSTAEGTGKAGDSKGGKSQRPGGGSRRRGGRSRGRRNRPPKGKQGGPADN